MYVFSHSCHRYSPVFSGAWIFLLHVCELPLRIISSAASSLLFPCWPAGFSRFDKPPQLLLANGLTSLWFPLCLRSVHQHHHFSLSPFSHQQGSVQNLLPQPLALQQLLQQRYAPFPVFQYWELF